MLHPEKERLQRGDPDDAGDAIDERLERPIEARDMVGLAADQAGPEQDEQKDERHAGRLAPGGLHILTNPRSVATAWIRTSHGSCGTRSISCIAQAKPIRCAPGNCWKARS